MAYNTTGTNKGKPHVRTIQRARIAVRLECRNMGIPLSDIAAHIGMSLSAFSVLRKTRLYRILKQQYFTGVLSIYDEDLIDDIEANKRTLKSGVPLAIENLIVFAADRTDKRICLEATKEILNRDGHHAAVTRIGLPTADQGGVTSKEDERVADELLGVLVKRKKVMTIEAEPKTDSIM